MKKKLIAAASAAVTAALLVCTPSVSAEQEQWQYLPDRGNENLTVDFSHADGNLACPEILVESVTLNADEAKGRVVTVNINIAGLNADLSYCTTGFHIYWDSRLTPIPNNSGNYASAGEAVRELGFSTGNIGTYGAFVMTTGKSNAGREGTQATLNLKLPDDAQPEDVYPIDIAFRSDTNRTDLFTNCSDDQYGKFMQNYVTRHGIFSSVNPSNKSVGGKLLGYADGYISVNKVLPVYTLGDVNSDGTVDARDASKVLTEYARFSTDQSYKPDEIFMLAADVNRNKIVDGNDATAIFTYYAKASAGKAGSFAEYIG